MTMHLVQHTPGGDARTLVLRDAPIPVPGDDEILVQVAYAGVNRPDVLQRMGLYNPPSDANPYLGLEISGTVHAVGRAVTRWRVGDTVCALTHGGGYAEYCLVDARHAMPVPAGLSLAQAAALPENYVTVWANLFAQGIVRAGKTVLVHGASSGIGITATQLSAQRGATVFATAGSDDKLAICRAHGAAVAINYRTQDFEQAVREATDGRGVDVVLDMVGGAYVEKNLRALALEGTLVQISFLQGSQMQIDLAPVMLKRLVWTGSTLRARTAQKKAELIAGLVDAFWPLLARGQCLPLVHTVVPLAEAWRAHALMESSQHSGKILLEVRPAG